MHNSLLMNHEAHFHLCESVNKQNCRYYSDANPHHIREKPFHSKRVTVWCGVAEWGIISSYFFTIKVNTMSYTSMIKMFLLPESKKDVDFVIPYFNKMDIYSFHETVNTVVWFSFDIAKLCFHLSMAFAWLVTLLLFPLGIFDVMGIHFQATSLTQ